MDKTQSAFSDKLIDEVEQFSNSQLKRKNDLQKIYKECLVNNTAHLFEELIFTGKYVNGLMKVLKKSAKSPEVQNIDYVKKDLSSNIKKLIEQINNILIHSDEETKNYFYNNLLQLTNEAFYNLNELISDFDWTKKYLNEIKRDVSN